MLSVELGTQPSQSRDFNVYTDTVCRSLAVGDEDDVLGKTSLTMGTIHHTRVLVGLSLKSHQLQLPSITNT